jgi:hypothetical protein
MATVMAVVGGTDNNQPKEAVEEMTAAAAVMVAETTMATKVAMVTVTMRMPKPMPMIVHQQHWNDEDNTTGMCLAARDHTVPLAYSGGDSDG